jgi:DNA-binding NarL/FixJ family response regulator
VCRYDAIGFVSQRLSVLLVDDHALVRRGFRRLLEHDPQIEVVGEASDGAAAIALADSLRPHVVVMDCAMPGTGGLTATRRILAQWPDAAILVVSAHGEDSFVRQAMEAGARGYVRKDALDFDLAAAVRHVAAGDTVVPPAPSDWQPPGSSTAPKLSPRQQQVLQLMCDGLSYAAIAERLGLSENTVAVHRANIMKTLRVHRSAELVAYAIRHGLVNLP